MRNTPAAVILPSRRCADRTRLPLLSLNVPPLTRHLRWLAAVLLLIGAAAGCARKGEEEAPDAPQTATDGLGRRVTFPHPPERVVTLAPNLTEIVFAAGAGEKLVGVTTADDYPPAVDTLARIAMLPTNFEAIAALRPDLVLATDQVNTPRDAETLAALDLPVYFFSFSTLDGVIEGIRTTGRLLGTAPAAEAAADSLRRAARRLRTRTASVENRPRVLFLIGDETLYAFGKDSYVHTLIELAGGQSLTAGLDATAPVLSEEFVIEEKPEVIIGAFGAEYDAAALLEKHPAWRGVVPAIEDGRVYSLEEGLVLRPGPRLVEGAWQMARMLHPALFDSVRADSVLAQPAGTP